ncbi:reverse transcriptase domain-containing protein [Tanacetum coccineum]
MPRECLRIIESKSKVHNSRNKAVVAKVSSNSSAPGISPDVAALTTKVSELKNLMKTMLIDKQKAQAPATQVKSVEQELCNTCGGVSILYRNCPATDGNVYRDNIQDNFNQGQVYQPPTIQTPVYQAPTPQMQGVSKTDFENFVKANDVVLQNMQNQGQGLQNQMTNLTEMLSKFITSNTASSSNSEIGLKDALIEMPKFNKWLSTLLRNKEKLEEIAITTVNAECSAIILNKVPEKHEDRGKFLIPCALQELDRTNALADSRASINLLPYSIYKQLGLGALKPTRMTLKLANRSVTHPMGIAKDVIVRVDGFTFLADFVVVNFEPDPRVPIILGRPFLHTAKALIDLYEEKLTLRVGNDELLFYAKKSKKSKNKQFAHAISVIDFSKDEPFSGSTTNHSDALPPSSSPVKTSDNLEEFADELTLKKMVEDVENKNSNVSNSDEPVLLNTPLSDKVECSDPEDDIDEIDAFLAMEVSSNFKEGYFDSEGDVIFLENLLSDDTTHNLAPEVISDHEPKQDESIHNTSITFSPRSDPLHHEFAGEIITLPSRIAREHEEYLSLMTVLCEISTSRSQENVHANPSSIIESPPASPIPVEDSDSIQEEIDIFLVPGDLIPPGVENDDSEDEDNSTFLPENESSILDPSSPRPPPEPLDVCLNFKPDTAMKNDEDFNQIVLSLNVEDVNPFTFVIWIFLPFFTYPEDSPVILSFSSEDLIFDPGIFIFHFSYLEPVVFSMEVFYSKYCSP